MTPRYLLLIAAAASFLCAAAAPPPKPSFDRAAWKSDFERIKTGLAQGYANLDWQVERRKMNLVRVSEQISGMLDKANSDVEAVLAFDRLVDAFRDPHLRLMSGPPPGSATLLPSQSIVDSPIARTDNCSGDGYTDRKAITPLPYASSPEWRELSPGPFQAGLIGDIGIVRIPSFSERDYQSVCRAVVTSKLTGRELQLATRAELNRRLAATIADLAAKGMTRLAIDISGNGGGTEWSSEVAGMLASGTLKRTAPRLAKPACDRRGLWEGKSVCSIYAGAAEIEEQQGTGVWTGPLALLVDFRTASASEELITWLKDNGRAVVGGQRTYGAGCGYMDGGNAIALKAAPLHIMVPNCSRYTSAGINEIEGIAPDVAIDWMMMKPESAAGAIRTLFRP